MKDITTIITIYIIKIFILVLKCFKKGGTTLPGKVALKLCPDILKYTSYGYKTIFVTGTNGKTTTTKMVVNTIKSNGHGVITNDAGANMKSGIATTFISGFSFRKDKGYAVIEIDEANLKLVSEDVKIDYLVITNIFRDQLDRYGEVYETLNKIVSGIKDDTVLILNGDEPLFGDINIPNEKCFFGLELDSDGAVDVNVEGKFCIKCGSPYSYNFVSYSHLGDYFCKECGYKRPNIDYLAKNIVQNKDGSSTFVYNNLDVKINQSGLYNIYNAMSAISVSEILNLNINNCIEVLEKEQSPFGRQEEVIINNKKLKLMLVKNPAGYNEALNVLTVLDDKVDAAFVLNDNFADGTDVSWIYDVSFEKVAPLLNNVFVGGTRMYDMAIRINISGVDKNHISVFNSYVEFLDKISKNDSDVVYVFLTYTAMLDFRKYLFDKKYINKLY